MRSRKQIVREVSQHTLRIQKTLEDANIKVVASSPASSAPALGHQHFDRRDQDKTINRLIKRLTDLGCEVEV